MCAIVGARSLAQASKQASTAAVRALAWLDGLCACYRRELLATGERMRPAL